MPVQHVLQTIEQMSDRYTDIWEELCLIESPTGCKEGVDAAGRYLADIARQRGWAVDELPHPVAGNALCFTLNPESTAAAVVFSGHIDTVHPVGSFGYPPVRRDGERIYGPGVTDCKGGVVAGLLAMDALAQCGFTDRPVKLIVQTDEETNSHQSNKETVAFMLRHAAGCAAFLNLEDAQENTAVLARKGILHYTVTVSGKAVHASRCTEGASAIAEAAHKLLALEQMKDAAGVTCNCGLIRGGTAANTVPEHCVFTVDIRFSSPEQCAAAQKAVHDIVNRTHVDGCSAQYVFEGVRPSMPYAQQNLELLERMNRLYARCGMPPLQARTLESGSDAAYITEAGIPCVDDMGVEGGNIHSLKEFAYISSLARSAKRLAAVALLL